MDIFQTDWFMWLVMIIVIGSIVAVWFDAFESSGFDDGEVWGFTKKLLRLAIGYLILPFVMIYMIFKKDP